MAQWLTVAAAAAAAVTVAAMAATTSSTATSFMASHKNLELDSQLHKKLYVFICERKIYTWIHEFGCSFFFFIFFFIFFFCFSFFLPLMCCNIMALECVKWLCMNEPPHLKYIIIIIIIMRRICLTPLMIYEWSERKKKLNKWSRHEACVSSVYANNNNNKPIVRYPIEISRNVWVYIYYYWMETRCVRDCSR